MRSTIYIPLRVPISIEKRRWFYTAREILMREGLDHVQILLEPNETVYAKNESENWFLKLLGWTEDAYLFGWYSNDDSTLHFTVSRCVFETFDTILHEVAHAIVHSHYPGYVEDDHGPWWKFQFHLLKDKYRQEYDRLLLKENSRRLEVALNDGASRVRIISPREFHEGSNN